MPCSGVLRNPIRGLATVRAASVPRRITDVTRASPATPVAFLHLPVAQLRCHLPPKCFPASASYLEPVTKMGREGIEREIESVTREDRKAERRPRSVGERESRYGPHVVCADPDAGQEESWYRGV